MKKTIRMTKLAASPDGVLEAGRQYKVSSRDADRLIKAGAAVPTEKDPAERKTEPEPDESDDAEWSDDPDAHICDECGYESTTAAGLAAHKRSHDAD